MIIEDEVLFQDVAVFGDDKEHSYRLECYDGWALGIALADDNSGDVPAEIIVRYPALKDVLGNETLTRKTLEYRGLGSDPSVIHYGDIMMAFGEIDNSELHLSITAHIVSEPCKENIMNLYSRDYSKRWVIFNKIKDPFLGFLKEAFPMLDWVYDDGCDEYGSNYIQYVAYTGDDNNYVLATIEK